MVIPETGQTIDGLFLDLWHDNGGALTFGNPVTPEVGLVDGRVVQYYEYARFEYWPTGDENGNLVRLGDLGDELRPVVVPRRIPARTFVGAPEDAQVVTASGVSGSMAEIAGMIRAWLPLSPERIAPDSPSHRYVPAAEHSVRDGFKAFWEATGEAAYLGNPLSEEYSLDGTVYQVFERGQLAWRAGIDPYLVPVGNVLAERYGLETAPVAPSDVPAYSPELFIPPVLSPGAPPAGAAPGAAKTIVVSLGQQSL